jgi:hypothetical protein
MSSHYFKFCPAVGCIVADLITQGAATLVDASVFRPTRIEEGALVLSPNPYPSGSMSL